VSAAPSDAVTALTDLRLGPLAGLVPSWRPAGESFPVPLWEQSLLPYARSLALSARAGTARTYLEALSRFVRFAEDPLAATAADVEAFLTRPRTGRHGGAEGPRSASSRVVELAAIRRYFRWAVRERLRETDPTEEIRLPSREPYRDVTALSAEEARTLLAAIPTGTLPGDRLRCLVLWYLLSGRRRAEVLSLRWGDLDLEDETYVYVGKGGKSQRRPLLPVLRDETVAYAEQWLLSREGDAFVFPGRYQDQPINAQLVARQLQLVASGAGIVLRRPVHSLRHTYSRMLRQVGASVEDVQASLDHSSLATTATYLRKLEGADDPWGAMLAELVLEKSGSMPSE
jgi:integrase/recombinase XerD